MFIAKKLIYFYFISKKFLQNSKNYCIMLLKNVKKVILMNNKNMNKISVFDVASYILHKLPNITTMKLQKLTYYCQAWSLAWDDVPLFDNDFEAWANGPVCRELFEKHKGKFYAEPDMFGNTNVNIFSDEQIDTMDAVIRDLGDKSPQWLSDLTHSERPWLEARKGVLPGEPCANIISKDSMLEYYSGI